MLATITRIYEDATHLWFKVADNDMLASGHPGVAGPASDDLDWTVEDGMLDGAIKTLQEVVEKRNRK